MITSRPLAALVLLGGAVACGAFGSATESSAGDGGADGGASSSGGSSSGNDGDGAASSSSGADGAPASGCAARSGFLLCSDFDGPGEVQEQLTQPSGKPWFVTENGTGLLTLAKVSSFSAPNALNSTGNGSTAIFQAGVTAEPIAVMKNVFRLSMAVRIDVLPNAGDAYFATLQFDNIRFNALLHANGAFDLAQSAPPGAALSKAERPTATAKVGSWSRLELYVNRGAGKVEASVGLNNLPGGAVGIEAVPTGNATVGVGIGYCDVPCGNPSLSFDDVVLVEE